MNHFSTEFESTVSGALNDLDQIPGSEELPVSERLTAFFFVLLDRVEAVGHPEEFKSDASGFTSAFHEALRTALSAVMLAPDVPLVNRLVTDSAPSRFIVAEMLVQLISTSINDTSEGKQRSAALSDKVLASAASFLASPIPQKAVDVIRYAVEAEYIPVSKIPIISDWFKVEGQSSKDESGEA